MVAVVLVAVGVSWASFLQTPTYEASAQVWVEQKQGDQETYLTGSGEMIKTLAPKGPELQAIIQTMAHAIDSRPVAEETIQRLRLRMKPAELLENLTVEPIQLLPLPIVPAELLETLTVEQVENTRFIVHPYEDTDPNRAKRIVNT